MLQYSGTDRAGTALTASRRPQLLGRLGSAALSSCADRRVARCSPSAARGARAEPDPDYDTDCSSGASACCVGVGRAAARDSQQVTSCVATRPAPAAPSKIPSPRRRGDTESRRADLAALPSLKPPLTPPLKQSPKPSPKSQLTPPPTPPLKQSLTPSPKSQLTPPPTPPLKQSPTPPLKQSPTPPLKQSPTPPLKQSPSPKAARHRVGTPNSTRGAMQALADANLNRLPAADCAPAAAGRPSTLKREAAPVHLSRPLRPASTGSSRPGARSSVNNNRCSPRRNCVSQPAAAGDAVGPRAAVTGSLGGQVTGSSDEVSSGEVSFDENVNPSPQQKAHGTALIIRRGSPARTVAPLSKESPMVRSGGFRDSEAGPEVALLPDDLFAPATAFFQDTAAVDVLTGSPNGLPSPTAGPDSLLLLRCDPRLGRAGQSPEKRRRTRTQHEESVSVSEKQLSLAKEEALIAFSPATNTLKREPTPRSAPLVKRESSAPPPDVAQSTPTPTPTPTPALAPTPVPVAALVPSATSSPAQSRAPTLSRQELAADQKAQQEFALQEQLLKRDQDVQTLQETVAKLKKQLATSHSAQQRMGKVLELHTSSLSRLTVSRCRLETQMTQQTQRLTSERDEAREEVASIETMFADLHRKYEKSKAMLAENRQTSELVSCELDQAMGQVSREQQRYDMLQQYAEDTMRRLQTDMVLEQKSQETETLRMSARLQLAENRASKLERENKEVTSICDELIQKMGGGDR